MDTFAAGYEKGNPQRNLSLLYYLGLLPVIVCFVLVIGLWRFPPAVTVFEPEFLLPSFNSFLFLASMVIAYIAWQSYVLSGSFTILWLGCGVLALGTGALAAGWLIRPYGPNDNVTIFNLAVLLAAVCHTGGVLASFKEHTGEAEPGHNRRQMTLAYLAVVAVIALIVGLAISDVIPPFFIQGQGPTLIRQYVVEWAIVLLSFASLIILSRFRRQRWAFLYWYALALALVVIAMLAFFLQPAVGSLIGWTGRSAYVLAAIYFLGAVNSARSQAISRGFGLSEAITELFSQVQYRALFDNMLNGLAYCRMHYKDGRPLDFTYLRVNRAFKSLTGLREVEGRRVSEVIPRVEESDPQLLEIYGRVALSGVPEQFETYVKGLDDWYLVSVYSPQKEHFVAIFDVITERKRAEEALRRAHDELEQRVQERTADLHQTVEALQGEISERERAQVLLANERQRFYSVLERIPAYVALISPDCKMPFANREFIRRFGDPGERSCHEFLFSLPQPCEDCKALEVFLTKVPAIWEWFGPDGNTYQIYDYPFADVDGSPLVLEMGVDITALKKAEQQIRKSEEDLRHLTSKILTTQEQERNRLARELHDGLGQSLSALKMYLRAIQRHLPKEAETIREDFEDAQKMLRDTIEETRKISRGLSPTLLENLGLTAAVKYLLDEFSKYHKTKITFDADDIQDSFSHQTQINLFRVCQEAINNIAKHSLPTKVSVTIKRQDGRVNFCIKDNGVGFDLKKFRKEDQSEKGMGIGAMDERLRMIGSHLTIASQTGSGTEISFSVSCDAK